MMNLQEDNSGFIRKLFLKHIGPGVAAQVASIIGPIICGVIAGTEFGKMGLAVTGLYTPLFFLAGFFGTIIAGGSAALAAKHIARNDSRRVIEIYTLALLLSAVCAAALFILCMLFRTPMLSLLTGSGELWEPAARYYTPSVWYICLTVLVYMPLFWARLTGRPSVALVMTLTLSGMSIACGTLYVYGIGMGLEGLAVAQAAASALALVISMAMLHIPKTGFRVCMPRNMREDAAALVLAGSPLGLSRLYRFVSLLLVNVILLNAIGLEAVAVFGVLIMLLRFVTAFTGGLSGVQMPIAGVLWEECDVTSLRQLARVTFIFGNAAMFAAAALALVFNRVIAGLFGMGGVIFFPALVCFCAYIPFYMNGTLFISWYTAVRRVKLANTVTLAQDMLLPPLLAMLFALGDGKLIWLHLPAAGIITAVLLPVLLASVRRGDKRFSFPLLLDTKRGGAALAFSVERNAEKAGEAAAAIGGFCEEQGIENRKSMLLSLAIEEMIILIAEQAAEGGDISVRLICFEGGIVLRLRDAGRNFNPIEHYTKQLGGAEDIEDKVGLMGITYIIETAEAVYYRETFGVNNLVVII
jgi:Na+-driven multidrug efflux pump/anti-sigma regulatory factor (Ser/Thr protein kinase)